MPTSLLSLAPTIVNLIEQCPHDRILDVGPGHGKYGLLAREYLNVKPTQLDACEADEGYLVEFGWLASIYDRIYSCPVEDLEADVLATYDLVLMADVIEHLDVDTARAVLDRIPGRVVISTPRDFFQNPEHVEHPYETHRSRWGVADFGSRVEIDASIEQWGAVVVVLGPQ